MTTLSEYLNKGTAADGVTKPQGMMWCRPQHKPTCCMAIFNGGTCCVCVPSTATCFIIEMWGQGGNGAFGCCCGIGSYGGQGGSYGWVACTTSGTNHILCACSCVCYCACQLCTGSAGNTSRVCNCTTLMSWIVNGGAGGVWCCNPSNGVCYAWCWAGSEQFSPMDGRYNTWYFLTNRSAALSDSTADNACLRLFDTVRTPTSSNAFTGLGSCPGNLLDTNMLWPCICTCTCFTSPVWVGACGWSDPSRKATPYSGIPAVSYPASNAVSTSFYGPGAGVGGAAYAGGDQAWALCTYYTNQSCYVQCGHFPGGGGMSAYTQAALSSGGIGASGLILISWC